MPKLKAPLLSLGARGSLADTLTFTKIFSGPRVQVIPTHPDARTLPQLYQRWRFRDANFYWLSLTPTQQAAYRAQRHPPNLTGHQRCIRYYLRNLPDLALHLHLDSRSGFTATDYSKNSNHGTIVGATPTPAIIDYGRLFDGVDDTLAIPHHSSLNTGISNFTLMSWLRISQFTQFHNKWSGPPPLGHASYLMTPPNYTMRFYIGDGIARNHNIPFLINPFDNQRHHLAYVIDFSHTLYFFLDASLQGTADLSLTTASIDNTQTLHIPYHDPFAPGTFDDIRLYTRALTPAHIRYIYEQERYPPAA